jgi:hypothetical protein
MTNIRSLLRAGALAFATLAAATMLQAADGMKTAMVAVSGPVATATGGLESVAFSGQVTVKTRVAVDADFGDSKLLLLLDLSALTGKGSTSGATYIVRAQQTVVRPLGSSQQIELNFPFFKSMSDPLTSTRTGVATLALNVDTVTGTVTSAAATAVSQ